MAHHLFAQQKFRYILATAEFLIRKVSLEVFAIMVGNEDLNNPCLRTTGAQEKKGDSAVQQNFLTCCVFQISSDLGTWDKIKLYFGTFNVYLGGPKVWEMVILLFG